MKNDCKHIYDDHTYCFIKPALPLSPILFTQINRQTVPILLVD